MARHAHQGAGARSPAGSEGLFRQLGGRDSPPEGERHGVRDIADPQHWMARKTALKQVLKLPVYVGRPHQRLTPSRALYARVSPAHRLVA